MKTELSETEIRAIKEGVQCGNNSPPGPGRVKEGMRGRGEDQRPLARAGVWSSFFSSRSRI
jgi:hypothetical protein